MLRQFVFGASVSLLNIVIHALIMTVVVGASQAAAERTATRPNILLIAVMVATASVLMFAHTCEILVWSMAYWLIEAVDGSEDYLYFAFVNFTTLGYGDIVPIETWRLLGPMTAMNGVLLFGWSTAVIFEVLRKTMTRRSLQTESEADRMTHAT